MDQVQVKIKKNYAEIGEAIDHELAAKMVKDFNDIHPDLGRDFVIGKNIIEKILAQPGCAAIRFYNAINEYGKQTLVYCGVDEKGNILDKYPVIGEDGKLYSVEALIGDRSNLSWFD
ncbi:MAG TPA: hypothetical protein VMI35_06165 [Puia sp.]|nr:hypothetical protein [Puia sp.]